MNLILFLVVTLLIFSDAKSDHLFHFQFEASFALEKNSPFEGKIFFHFLGEEEKNIEPFLERIIFGQKFGCFLFKLRSRKEGRVDGVYF